MFMFNLNESINVAQLQKLSDQSMLKCAFVIEIVAILIEKARKTLVVS